jgi:hypothetical protein
MEIIWTENVRNYKVSLRVKKQRNILHKISKRKANWIGHILRRNCLLQDDQKVFVHLMVTIQKEVHRDFLIILYNRLLRKDKKGVRSDREARKKK